MVVGVPADFESRNQELSNDTKILLQDHFVRFGGKSALYVQTILMPALVSKIENYENVLPKDSSFKYKP